MIHPHSELKFVSESIGYGIFATQRIPKGTITWVKDELDRAFGPEEVKTLTKPNYDNLMKYSYMDGEGNYFFCWDLTRFVNHSFTPNTMPTAMGLEVAIRDIEIGEEITNDYGSFNLIEPFECANGPHNGRSHVLPDDLKNFHPQWDLEIADALRFQTLVLQPLTSFLTSDQIQKLEKIRSGEMEIPSLMNNYFEQKLTCR